MKTSRINKIFESILDEYKILKEKVKRYKDLPKKYGKIESKYMNIQDEKDSKEKFKVVLNGTELSDIQVKDKINEVKKKIVEKRNLPASGYFENRSRSLRKSDIQKVKLM